MKIFFYATILAAVANATRSKCGSLAGCFLRNLDFPESGDIELLSAGVVTTYTVGRHDSFSIRCELVADAGEIDRVEFAYNGETKTEYSDPYWARGDSPGWINRLDYLREGCPVRKQVTVAGYIWSEHEPCFEETFELFAMCDGFNIQLDLNGVTNDAILSPFTDAADRWATVVTGDLTPIPNFAALASLTALEAQYNCVYPEDVDDLSICAATAAIDGPSVPGVPNVLGFAGPTFLRTSNILPISGIMVFDEADVGVSITGQSLKSTILHEMAHVLGIGTLWEVLGLTGSDEDDCPYSTNSRAFAEYQLISGCDSLPIELELGPGSRCGHWAEDCFGPELMTPSIQANERFSPLSQITAASLEDLGYEISYDIVDFIGAEDLSSTCVCGSPHRQLRRDISSPAAAPRRRLSAQAKEMAAEYGAKMLSAHSMPPEKLKELPSDVTYIGGTVGVVYVIEDGTLFEVVVSSSSD